MPITAKLSKALYERLGEEIADQLVDWFNQVERTARADLREFNELNFARFDAKLEQRVDALEAKLEQRVSALETKLEQRVSALETKLDKRVSELDQRFATLETKMEHGFAALRVEWKADLAESERTVIDRLAAQRAEILKWNVVLWITAILAIVGIR